MESVHQDLELVPGAWGSGQSRVGPPAGMFQRRMVVKQCVLIPGALMRVIWKTLGSHCPGWFMPQVHLGVISKETTDSQRGRGWSLSWQSQCFRGAWPGVPCLNLPRVERRCGVGLNRLFQWPTVWFWGRGRLGIFLHLTVSTTYLLGRAYVGGGP